MTLDDYRTLSAGDIAARVNARSASAAQMVEAAFATIDRVEPHIHAFATLTRDNARGAAAAVDARVARGEGGGPLAGVPVAIKDLVLTKGVRTTFGSNLYANYIPDHDDIVVERLTAAGAIVIGKSNASEFGFGAHGCNLLFPVTRNPWDLSRSPGGSSAGSAAAVAAGVCPIAIGSDGGGSIRIPAAFSGLFGIKASMGRVPLWPGCRDETLPGASGWESIEHVGPITRTVADAALMLSVIAGPDGRDRLSLPGGDVDWSRAPGEALRPGTRVAYWPQWHRQPIDRRVKALVDAAVTDFARAYDLDLVVEMPPMDDLFTAFGALVALETDLTGMRRLVAARDVPVTEALSGLLAQRLPIEAATDAMTTRKAFANAMARRMADVDFVLTPTAPIVAFAAEASGPGEIEGVPVGPEGWAPFTFPFNLTGQPAASIPCGLVEGRWPVGLQIVGRHLADAAVLAASAAFERLRPAPRPPMGI